MEIRSTNLSKFSEAIIRQARNWYICFPSELSGPNLCSWNPDKNAYVIDAFSISWTNLKFYAFLPFSLIGTSISKIRREMTVGIMIIPWWVTQFWFPMMVALLQDFPVVLSPDVLTLPSNKALQHPLYPKMKLLAVQVV